MYGHGSVLPWPSVVMSSHPVLTSDFLASLATDPGVYLMLDKRHKVIYVGKARNLKKRVTSYARFKGSEHHKTAALIRRIAKVETLITRTEKEALILEASLIKKHRPKYNVILRDDKNYPLIKVTVQEQWPRVVMSRRRHKDGARYFGPYASSSAMWATLKLISSLLPLRRCKGAVVKERQRPCLNGQMKHCLMPCLGQADRQQYELAVERVIMILEGKNRELLAQLKEEMVAASEQLDFELAAQRRDQIQALQRTVEKQLVVASGERSQDVFGLWLSGGSLAVAVLMVRHGMLLSHTTFFLAEPLGSRQTWPTRSERSSTPRAFVRRRKEHVTDRSQRPASGPGLDGRYLLVFCRALGGVFLRVVPG